MKTERKCTWCEGDMPITARADARTCSTRCRVAAHRATKKRVFPLELTTRKRWVRRSTRKVPLTTVGRAASSTDPRTWGTYRNATESVAGVGLGFVLDGDGIVCVDLDHAIAPDGSLKPWAEDIVSQAGATYTEISASGEGLHIFGYADVRQGRRIRREGGYAVEVYGDERYIAMTGQRFRGAPTTLADISALVGQLTA
ncbi:DNA primase [Streptomyces sp. NBC_00882]|uniref:bifunctional DNA primase/polymerase n=1 Tax=Streptomyces sp. NBC_00882 TaxID=2975856 RepID=UPI003869410E|nr:DNA primase [Streptomyces sp. NBC_00882]